MMEEVSNGIILNDIKNFEHDNNVKKLSMDKRLEDPNVAQGLFGKLISVRINKMKGWAPINDNDGYKKAKMIMKVTNKIENRKISDSIVNI